MYGLAYSLLNNRQEVEDLVQGGRPAIAGGRSPGCCGDWWVTSSIKFMRISREAHANPPRPETRVLVLSNEI